MMEQFQLDDSADMNRPPVSLRNWILLERQTVSFSGYSRYLTPLQVYSTDLGLELGADIIEPDHQKIQDKIITALKLLTFREQQVVVQFWSPHVVGKHQSLATIDQPFGLGTLNEGLCTYRRDSEPKFFVLNNDHEEDCFPVLRVFKRGLPEWTTDLNNYTLKHFPHQEFANRCNLHGYLALPVFDLTIGICAGVLEVLTSSEYKDFAYEVQNIHDALETVTLTSPQVFEFPALNAPNEHRQKDFDKIYRILKTTCDIHSLPLAQTWAVSQHTSFVAHENVIEKSCSSFDTRCVRKVCMSTAALLSYVKDLSMWPFLKACRERHLDRSRGLVGRALLSRSSCFFDDVTRLSEEEYPLVHNARMNGLTSCFAIFLHSIEPNDDYVLEFFLPPDSGHWQVLNLVKTLKQNIPIGSGFEVGDTSSIEDVGPLNNLFANMVSDVSYTSSDCMDDNSDSESLYSSDSESLCSSDSESLCSSVTEMVIARITLIDHSQIVQFPVSLGFANLKNEVAHIFDLEGEIRLKYMDEDNDEILITCDDDLKYAVHTAGSNDNIDIICQPASSLSSAIKSRDKLAPVSLCMSRSTGTFCLFETILLVSLLTLNLEVNQNPKDINHHPTWLDMKHENVHDLSELTKSRIMPDLVDAKDHDFLKGPMYTGCSNWT